MKIEKVGSDHFMFMNSDEIVGAAREHRAWMLFQRGIHKGMPTTDEFEHDAALGNESYVKRSDEFLSSIEDQIPLSRGWRNVDDVVGAVPNVPAFLAGHPQHMRRRARVDVETAPLSIFMDLGSSMSISKELILKRGIVLLALVRMLSTHRAVDLWVGSCLSDGWQTGTCAWHIDTTPLDLARAAFHIADASMSRLFAYAMCETMVNKHLGSHPNNLAKHMQKVKAVAGWHDILLLPPISMYDPMVANPMGWLRGTMKKFIPTEGEE
jgi:hypothetical protein